MLRLAVLISGRGSNLMAIEQACREGTLDARIDLVIADRPATAGLAAAAERGYRCAVIDRAQLGSRELFEAALDAALRQQTLDLVVLAGFMRVLSGGFVARWAGRLVNIHPSLLPAFKGLNTHRQALAAAATEHGASVHYVTADLDGGPVIAQSAVPVLPDDDETSLSARVQAAEHKLYPAVLQWIASGRLQLTPAGPSLDARLLEHPERIPASS